MKRVLANSVLVVASLGLTGGGSAMMAASTPETYPTSDILAESIQPKDTVEQDTLLAVGGAALILSGLTGLILTGKQIAGDIRQHIR